MKYPVYAIHGAKGSGKDTVGSIILAHYDRNGIGGEQVAFADPIKKMVCKILNIHTSEWDSFKRSTVTINTNPPHEVAGRHVGREIGMLMRHYDEDQFVNYVLDTLRTQERPVVITDLRFRNELDMLSSAKDIRPVYLIKVKRPGVEFDGHASEIEFDDQLFDLVIDNNGSLRDLIRAVENKVFFI